MTKNTQILSEDILVAALEEALKARGMSEQETKEIMDEVHRRVVVRLYGEVVK